MADTTDELNNADSQQGNPNDRPKPNDFKSTYSTYQSRTQQLKFGRDGSYMDDNAIAGQPFFQIPLDPDMTERLQIFLQGYEYWSMQDFTISLVNTSPLGTSSGAIQIAHVTDPENGTLSNDIAGYPTNLAKVIRQQGSVTIRPRDTQLLNVRTTGTLYSHKVNGLNRFSSFGSILAVVREPPAAGDKVSFAITIEGTAVGMRPAIVQNPIGQELSAVGEISEPKITIRNSDTASFIMFELPKDFDMLHGRNYVFVPAEIPYYRTLKEYKNGIAPHSYTIKPQFRKARFYSIKADKETGEVSEVLDPKLLHMVVGVVRHRIINPMLPKKLHYMVMSDRIKQA